MKSAVVLAAWNGAAYLEEQLDSIAAQSIKTDRIYIRDDASSDNTLAIAEAWKAEHPGLSVTILEDAAPEKNETDAVRKNLGYIGNFCRLLEAAAEDEEGPEWIFLSDQDDRWHPDKIKTMMEAVQNDPSIRLLASSFSFMNAQGAVYEVPLRPGWSNNNLIPWQVENPGGINAVSEEQMLLHNYFQGCAMLVRRDLVREYLAKKELRLAHDWMLALLAAAKGGLYYLDLPLFDYRIHESNTTGLPQAKGRSKIRTLKTWFNGYYRRVVVEDMLRVLQVVEEKMPERWNADLKARKEFCLSYLDCLKNRDFKSYRKLRSHPGRKACMSGKEYLVGAAYVFASRFVDFPDRRI